MKWDAIAIVCGSCIAAEVVWSAVSGDKFGYSEVLTAVLSSVLTAAVIAASGNKPQ